MPHGGGQTLGAGRGGWVVQESMVGSAIAGTTQLLIEVVEVSRPSWKSCDIRSGFPRLPCQVYVPAMGLAA